MISKRNKLLLYTALSLLAAMFLFPFYWVVMSSVKSREGITMIPPAFYPAETRTADLALPADGRVAEYDGQRWVRLCRSTDLMNDGDAPGAYFARLEADLPTQSVAWIPDGAARPVDRASLERIRFANAPVHRLEDDGRDVAVAARMIRRDDDGGFDEILFAAPADAATVDAFAPLLNRPHRELRRFAPRWANYAETLRGPEATFGERSIGFLTYMRNSFVISALAVLGQVFASSLVAFGFARLRFRGRDALFVLLLATLMIPAQVTLIPLFAIYKQLGWIDTFLPLVVHHFCGGAFNIFLVRQYLLTLPRELDESAAIDGCGPFRTYWHIVLPNCAPVLIVVALFTFVYTWQDVIGPLIYLDDPGLRTVTLGLEYFRSPYVDNRHLLMTGAVLAMAPVAVVFLFLQRHIMAGIATTGLKG